MKKLTDTLKDLRGRKEGCNIGDAEVVLAFCNGVGTGGGETGSQEVDVGLLLGSDLVAAVRSSVIDAI